MHPTLWLRRPTSQPLCHTLARLCAVCAPVELTKLLAMLSVMVALLSLDVREIGLQLVLSPQTRSVLPVALVPGLVDLGSMTSAVLYLQWHRLHHSFMVLVLRWVE